MWRTFSTSARLVTAGRCTAGIQAAINACAAAGGGKVFVPPGKYLTGPIFLKSNLEFEVLAGATLLGSTNFADYPTIPGWWEGLERTVYASMITGIDLENVAITGQGTLDGQGAVWLDAWDKTEQLRKKLGLIGREPENPPGSPLPWPRPRVINLYRSHKVLIRGLAFHDSPSWTVHPVLCEDVYIEGLTIVNPPHSWNTDGIDPESCRNVRISGCYISTGDDCIMLKSGYKQIPEKPFLPTENIAVTNCTFNAGGCGVGIGSETAGGVRKVAISFAYATERPAGYISGLRADEAMWWKTCRRLMWSCETSKIRGLSSACSTRMKIEALCTQ